MDGCHIHFHKLLTIIGHFFSKTVLNWVVEILAGEGRGSERWLPLSLIYKERKIRTGGIVLQWLNHTS